MSFIEKERQRREEARTRMQGKHGDAITTLEQLHAAAMSKRSVIGIGTHGKPVPAAIALCWQGGMLLMHMSQGLFLYNRPPSTSIYKKP